MRKSCKEQQWGQSSFGFALNFHSPVLFCDKKRVKKEGSLRIYRVLTVVCIIDIKDQNIKGILETTAVCNTAG